jgi:poly(3-hydroxybutyrate) depolymerase
MRVMSSCGWRWAGICALAISPVVQAAQHTAEFQHIYNYDPNDDGSISLHGRLLEPIGYDPSKSYPLVVFYHGQGEKGTNNTSQVNGNIDNLVAAAQSRGFFVYAPQVDANSWYKSSVDQSMKIVSQIIKDFNIDINRLYVTGLSMGGSGTYSVIGRYTDAFAAAVPVAGGLTADPGGGLNLAPALVGKPIWMFHAQGDTTVRPNETSRAMINAIRAADGGKPPLTFRLNADPSNPYYNTGAPYYSAASGTTFYSENNLRYTEYSDSSHNSWTRAYADQNMWDWLLSQTSSLTTLAMNKTIYIDLGYNNPVEVDSQGRAWNSVAHLSNTTFGTAVPFAKDSEGTNTTVEVSVVRKFVGNFNNTSITGSPLFDDAVIMDGWSVGTTAGNANTIANPGELLISGLTPGGEYRIELFGTRPDNDGGRGAIARYTINGEYRDLDVVGNLDKTAVFESVIAGVNGELTLTVAVAPGTSRYGHLNAFSITAVPEPAWAGIVLLGATLLRRRSARRTTNTN